ncbi:unnamed protein product [Penicillium salamii]|uniref:Zn(2)-C6 fungal-type domain-containing protein n=1 Tax=Penicillium salamii TaxID=1612424 RepID=A0A9W4K2P5_9EURO|nr:unnamed protein product [Penicillium salamii]CAG8206403.1 unnamed protein product [Penicillium salamii]CAG8364211.1 unnamed protein product [Penicillium salamii]CAG8368635.1 unnamed protein product [Penicillium salamii]CAG8397580.1 unnamed protein product [Penicillium salamii]
MPGWHCAGCHNCSQRRINCDRNSPCQKCIKKGIECWGLGVRYRFSNGVASRGKLAGKTIPVTDDEFAGPNTITDKKPDEASTTQTPMSLLEYSLEDLMTCHIDHLDQQARFLLEYFSQKVAPAMVAIDIKNGYRDILLPLSEHDEITRNAMIAASASHLSHQHPDSKWLSVARKHHTAAIKGLQRDGSTGANTFSDLATMVILLIEEMVSVGEDYIILLRMVRSFVCSRGGDKKIEQSPIGRFLIQQIRKMTLYAAPLVSEISATSSLSHISTADIAILYCSQIDSTNESIIANVADLVHQAMHIYLLRVTNNSEEVIEERVQHFIDTALLFNATSFGGHVLIWPFFIVGAECSNTHHQEFIVTQLQCLWKSTGFANILYAISFLEKVWQNLSRETWPSMLVKHVEGFIM